MRKQNDITLGPDEKWCPKCKQAKKKSEFCKHKGKHDGLHPHCKLCVKEYQKLYREANPEKVRERQKRWREANPEKVSEHQKRYYEKNKDAIKLGNKIGVPMTMAREVIEINKGGIAAAIEFNESI